MLKDVCFDFFSANLNCFNVPALRSLDQTKEEHSLELVQRMIDLMINLRNMGFLVRDSTLSEKSDNGMMERRYEVNWMDGAGLVLWGRGGGSMNTSGGRKL